MLVRTELRGVIIERILDRLHHRVDVEFVTFLIVNLDADILFRADKLPIDILGRNLLGVV